MIFNQVFFFFFQNFRKAISVHYASSNCDYIDVSNTTQDNIKNEVLDIMAKKGITDVDYTVCYFKNVFNKTINCY